MTKSSNCPDHNRLSSYLKGGLSEPEAIAIEEHLSECETCETAIRTLDHLGGTLISVLREAEAPCEPFVPDPQFRQAVEAICKLPEGDMPPADQSPQEEDRPLPHPGPLPESERTVGRILGEYEIRERLPGGGMGTIYKAWHTRLNRFVALKMLPEGRHDDAAANSRFDREMRAVGSLDHPNIVRASDAREIDGRRVLVMEFVEGMDLADLVRHHGPLPIADACEIIRQAALGLQSAHEQGLVHRDIKPSNLMLTPQGQVKLLDLGLALFQAQPPTETEMTAAGQTVGTAEYMAPEQVTDPHTVDVRADIYGLGCTLYKLLTGHAPFDSPRYRTRITKMAAHLRDRIPPIRRERKEVPAALAKVLHKMLARSPARRHATPGAVAAALAPACTACDLPALLARASKIKADRESRAGVAGTLGCGESCAPEAGSTSSTKPAGQAGNAPTPSDPGGKQGSDPFSRPSALPHPLGRPEKMDPTPFPPWWRRPIVLACALAAAAALVFLTVLLIPTRSGTLEIDVDPPAAEVSIDGEKITLSVPNVKDKVEIQLRPGEHAFEVQYHGFSTQTGSFTLDAGGRHVLAVKLQEPPVEHLPKLVFGEWIKLFTSPDQLVGWGPMYDRVSYSNHTLETRGGGLEYPIVAKDVSLRARAKKEPGQNICLTLRACEKGRYIAWFNGGRSFGIGIACGKKLVDDNYRFADLATGNAPQSYDDFFDFAFSAVGDALTLSVNGKPLLQTHDSSLEMGTVAVGGVGSGLFKEVAIFIPSSDSLVADHRWPPGVPPLADEPFAETKAEEHQAAWAKYLNLPVVQTNSIGMQLVLIPPGVFHRGSTPEEVARAIADEKDKGDSLYLDRVSSEAPRHIVTITGPFYLGMYQVTQGEYEKVMGTNPSSFTDKQLDPSRFHPPLPDSERDSVRKQRIDDRKTAAGKDTSRHPVETVTWDEAAEFCRRLSELPAERAAGRVYRLPTEAEWEDACRAGTTTRWNCGDDEAGLADSAWYAANSGGMTHPVGEKKPNAWGLYDMHGNVCQWCWDGFDKDHYAKSRIMEDPARPPDFLFRVNRGSSWQNTAGPCRSASRGATRPEFRNHGLGLRVYLEIADLPGVRARVRPAANPPSPAGHFSGSLIGPDGKWSLPSGAPPPAVAPFDAATAIQHQTAWATYLGAPVVQTNSVGMKVTLIPPGEFMMGSPQEVIDEERKRPKTNAQDWYLNNVPLEGPQHRVRITRPYWLGTTVVTQEEYQRVIGSNPSKYQDPKRPAERVSWDDAVEFCRKLSELPAEEAANRVYSLPTEAQWEYACRAGTTTRWYSGDDEAGLLDVAWFIKNAGDTTHPVAEKKPNAWGLYDMYGNVWQWCQDLSRLVPYSNAAADDPAGPSVGMDRVMRGAAWNCQAWSCRSAFRHAFVPSQRGNNGFRVVCAIDDSPGRPPADNGSQSTAADTVALKDFFQAVPGRWVPVFSSEKDLDKLQVGPGADPVGPLLATGAIKFHDGILESSGQVLWIPAVKSSVQGIRAKVKMRGGNTDLYVRGRGKDGAYLTFFQPHGFMGMGVIIRSGTNSKYSGDRKGGGCFLKGNEEFVPIGSAAIGDRWVCEINGATLELRDKRVESGSPAFGGGPTFFKDVEVFVPERDFYEAPKSTSPVADADEFTNGIGATLVRVKPGQFYMGSQPSEANHLASEELHDVAISKPFYIGKCAITQEQYQAVMGANPSSFCAAGKSADLVQGIDTRRYPVESVSWFDAQRFCEKLSEREQRRYRLPTEAEWEYCCRAATDTPFCYGNGVDLNNANANHFYWGPMRVGIFPANPWGICDMHGNVAEWCQDFFSATYYKESPASDPTGPASGVNRVVRGGSWSTPVSRCRSAARSSEVPSARRDDLGFRIVTD